MKTSKFILTVLFSIFFHTLPSFGVEMPAKEGVKNTPTDSINWRKDPFLFKEKSSSLKFPRVNGFASKTSGNMKDAKKNAESPDFNIQGILKADNSKYNALINGRIVKVGDIIDDYKVLNIKRYEIVLQKDKEKKIVYDIYQGKLDRGIK